MLKNVNADESMYVDSAYFCSLKKLFRHQRIFKKKTGANQSIRMIFEGSCDTRLIILNKKNITV